MSLEPFYAATPVIKLHIVAALAVIVLTPLQFWGFQKGSVLHRVSGYGWLASMVMVAVSSFWISSHFRFSIGGLSWIHLLSAWTLISAFLAIRHARSGQISAHRKTLIALAIGFWIAGAFTLIPPRIMGRIFFG